MDDIVRIPFKRNFTGSVFTLRDFDKRENRNCKIKRTKEKSNGLSE